MKKEIFAAALLIALSVGSVINLNYLRDCTGAVTAGIDAACEFAQAGRWDSAVSSAEKAEKTWSSASVYTGVFIRHTEADGVSDAFFDFLGAVYGKDSASVRRAGLILKKRIRGLYEMERPSLGSIL